jgi:hypothetical protein
MEYFKYFKQRNIIINGILALKDSSCGGAFIIFFIVLKFF